MSATRKLLAATAALAVAVVVGGAAVATSARSAPTAAAATGCTSSKGTLKYGIAGAGISQLDPNTINFAGQAPLQTLLYNGLAKYDRNMNVVPDLATKWKASADLKTWIFTLRKGVKYSTGRAFTAEDARANILRVLDPPSRRSSARTRRTSAPSACSARRAPDQAGEPERAASERARRHQDERHSNVADLAKSGTGTGPYKVGSFVRTSRCRSYRTRTTSAAVRAWPGSSSSVSPTRRRW